MKKLMLIASIFTVHIYAMNRNINFTTEKTLQNAYNCLLLHAVYQSKIQNMIEELPAWEAELNAIDVQIEQQFFPSEKLSFPSEELMKTLCGFTVKFRNLQYTISRAKRMRFYEDVTEEMKNASNRIEALYDKILLTLYENVLAYQNDVE